MINKQCLGLTVLLLLLPSLRAQYPGSDTHAMFSSPLAEADQQQGFPSNPAALASRANAPMGKENGLGFLYANINLTSLVWLTDLPGLRDHIISRLSADDYANTMANGTSFESPKVNSFGSLINLAQSSYQNRLIKQVLPSLLLSMLTPPVGMDNNTLAGDQEYQGFLTTVNNDFAQVRENSGAVIADVVDKFSSNIDFMSFYDNVELFRFFIIRNGFALQLAATSHAFFRPDLSAKIDADISGIKRLKVSEYDPAQLPTSNEVLAQPNTAKSKVSTELTRMAKQTSTDLGNSVNVQQLLVDNIYQILAQGKIRFFFASEIDLQLGYGFNIVEGVWQLGLMGNVQFFLGRDNYTLGEDAINLSLLPSIINPITSLPGIHAGLNVGSSLRLTPWLTWGLVLSDIVGIAHSDKNTSNANFGSFYYPIDVDSALGAAFYLGGILQLRLGLEAYDILDIFLKHQRFDRQFELIDHFRGFVMLDWIRTFAIIAQYYNRYLGAGFELTFRDFSPSFLVNFSPVTLAINIEARIVSFSWQ